MKSKVLGWLINKFKNLIPCKGESLFKGLLKVVAIHLVLLVIIFFLPILITMVLFIIVKELEMKNNKLKNILLILIITSGIFLTSLYWGLGSSKPNDDKDNQVNYSNSESFDDEENDIYSLLNETKEIINEFNRNLEIASQYNLDLKDYESIENLDFNEESSYEEIQEVLGTFASYNDTLERSINDAKNQTYKVTQIVDGDTIKIIYNEIEESVRLIGIDTPETVHPTKAVECFGKEASDKMKEFVHDKDVGIMFDTSQGLRDKYGRLLLYVWVGETFVNKEMIIEGYAYEYTYSTPYKYQDEFKAAQKEAESSLRGLWGDVCSCDLEEIKRSCTSCKVASVTYQNWDCTTYTKSITDNSCTSGCTVSKPSPSPTYVCDCSKTCTQISSCAEAYYQLNTCGCKARDGDKDGIPCENLCN